MTAKSQVMLTSTVSVSEYQQLEVKADREGLVDFLKQRLEERYLEPMASVVPSRQHGFAIMAFCCLLTETFGAFLRGFPDTRGKSEEAVRAALNWQSHFMELRGYEGQFYTNVRCGILHVGETQGGWLIRRTGPLFDPETRVLNANRYRINLEGALKSYYETLAQSAWASQEWRNFRLRMAGAIEMTRSG